MRPILVFAALVLAFLAGMATVFAVASLYGGAPKDWRDGGWRDAEPGPEGV